MFFDHRRGRFWASPRTIRRALTMGKHEMCKKHVRVRILKNLRCENGRKVFPKDSKTIFIIRKIKTIENSQFNIKFVLQSKIYFSNVFKLLQRNCYVIDMFESFWFPSRSGRMRSLSRDIKRLRVRLLLQEEGVGKKHRMKF